MGNDDANITFVYSKNFAHGYGMVYNAGGERVEGFSSMLWMLTVSLLFKLTGSPEMLILILNMLILSLGLTYLSNAFIHLHANKKSSNWILYLALILTWVVAIPNYVVWGTLTLMEFGLFSTILMSLLAIVLRIAAGTHTKVERRLFLGLIVALVLIRPEGMMWGPVMIVLHFLAQWYARNSFRPAFRVALAPVGAFVLTLISLIGFRLWYFGYPFPNTYYAKVSSDLIYNAKQGVLYILSFAESNIFVQLILALAFGLFVAVAIKGIINTFQSKRLSANELYLFIITAVILAGLLTPVVNGGDNFAQYRLFQPIWPVFILVLIQAGLLIDISAIKLNRFYAGIVTVIICFVLFYNANFIQWHKYKDQVFSTNAPQFRLSLDDRNNGIAFNNFFSTLPKLPSIGVVAAGGIKMTYQGEVNDLLGLNNVAMAHANSIKTGIKSHAAFSKDVFYQQKPQILNLFLTNGYEIADNAELQKLIVYWNDILKNLYRDERFQTEYTHAVIHNARIDKYLFGVYRNDFLRTLPQNEFHVRPTNR